MNRAHVMRCGPCWCAQVVSQPQIITPGATYFVSRRTIRRHHLFAPDPQMRQIFLYSLAVAAERYGVLVHFAVLMSTHEHLVITDVRGELPAFLQFFHRLVALATKALRKWDGPVWDHRKPSVVRLLTAQAAVEKIGYGIANPAAAGLVRHGEDWPGVMVRVDELGRAVWRIERPAFYFDPTNESWPDVVELRITLPPAAVELGTPDEFRELVRAEVEHLEADARAEMERKGWSFLGVDRCRKLSPFRRARSWEPLRSLNPTFAVGRGRAPERAAAIAQLREFRADYREALRAWRDGDRGVAFPPGTWLMRVVHAARVAPLAAAA